MVLNELALFSGVGMLSEGCRCGFEFMGIETRTVCHVEIEDYPASILVARMQEGSIPQAPVWGDVSTFNARAWRGAVDIVVAGFPCTDLSVAGKRAGLDGKRSGLFFEVVRIATDSGARLMLLENVAGIASATATVVDAEEGELDERAASRVLGELADLGWDSEWITLSASDVGASHGRARWFCFAWRELGNTESEREIGKSNEQQRSSASVHTSEHMGHTDQQRTHRSGSSEQQAGGGEPAYASGSMEVAARLGRSQGRAEPVRQQGRLDVDQPSQPMADTRLARPQRRELGGTRASHRGGQEAHGSVSELCGLFAPGPSDARWGDIIAGEPWRSPALSESEQRAAGKRYAQAQPVLRGTPDGLAPRLDFDHRAARLKCVGNGVVPLCAALATVVLARRAGIA